jgi:hypothetical protein
MGEKKKEDEAEKEKKKKKNLKSVSFYTQNI